MKRTRRVKMMALLISLVVAPACARLSADGGDRHQGEQNEAEAGTVHLDSAALILGGVRTGEPVRVTSRTFRVTGSVGYDPARIAQVGPRVAGRIVRLDAQVGSRVQKGAVLAHLESAEVGAMRADLREAESLVEIARENHEREARLEGMGISSRRELREAEAELRGVEARLASARANLEVAGTEHHVGEHGGHYDLLAPLTGTVVNVDGSTGEVASADGQVVTVADLTRLWVTLDIYEGDLADVSEGQEVQVTTAAWPDRSFPGRIAYVGEVLDTERRTVAARVEVENGDGLLKPGMFAAADIRVEDPEGAWAVPRDAVQLLEGVSVVWVPTGEPGTFRSVPVRVGDEVGDGLVEILDGLQAGDSLVVAGAFTLKAELLKGQFGEHAH